MTTWTNKDGLKVNYNLQSAETSPAGATSNDPSSQLVIHYDGVNRRTELVTAGNTDGREPFIPANSIITSAQVVVKTAFTSAGATTLSIGLAQDDGTVIDADGIDATIAKGVLDACLLYTSPSPRDGLLSRMPSSA